MKIVITVLLGLSLFLGGCSQRTEYVYVKAPAYPFVVQEAPADKKFPVRSDYAPAFKAYKAEMYGVIENLNNQIQKYLELQEK